MIQSFPAHVHVAYALHQRNEARVKARSSIHFMTWYFPLMPSFHSSWLLQTRVCVGAVGKRKRTLTGVSDQNRGQLFNFPPTFDLTHQLTIVWPNRHQATKGNCICSCGPTSIQPSPVSPSPWSQITVAVCRPGASLEQLVPPTQTACDTKALAWNSHQVIGWYF